MSRYSIYSKSTGRILRGGATLTGSEHVHINNPDEAVYVNPNDNANHIDDQKHLLLEQPDGTVKLVDMAPPTPDGDHLKALIAIRVNRLLVSSDIEVMPDRWEDMDATTRASWKNYRKVLRQILKTDYKTFPPLPKRPDGKGA